MLKMRNPETGRLTAWGNLAMVGAGAGALATAACTPGSKNSPEVTATPESEQILVWPGKGPLSEGYPDWSEGNLREAVVADVGSGVVHLLTVIDARLSAPRQIDPEKDWGAGPQQGASVEAAQTDLPNDDRYYKTIEGNDYIKDGTVVNIVGYTENGQRTCHDGGSNDSTRWFKVTAAEGHPEGWVAETLLSPKYLPSDYQLDAVGINQDATQAQYAGTSQGGC